MDNMVNAEIIAAARSFVTPDGPRKVVRRPVTDATMDEIVLPFKVRLPFQSEKDGDQNNLSVRIWRGKNNDIHKDNVGKRVLLVHGWAATQTDMFHYVPPLVELGYTAVVLDLPAHGASTGDCAGLDQLAEGVLAVSRALGQFDAVIAHSIGCAAVQLAIAGGMRVERVVMLASPSNYELGARYIAKQHNLDAAQTEKMFELLAGENVRVAIASADIVRYFTVLALIVHANDDNIIPVSVSEHIASLWPNSQLLKVDELKHRGVLKDSKLIANVISFVDNRPVLTVD